MHHFVKQQRQAHGFAGSDHIIESDRFHRRRLRYIQSQPPKNRIERRIWYWQRICLHDANPVQLVIAEMLPQSQL